ncbi:metal-dependent hydrolase [Methanomicrobium antiquum]|uniref:Metal-dependent hydrolase n=1 Tax=Methanomicrobium antiquum TaxID=487686 RepID=A0AAF0FPM6_9EURY|nr:metal-dependent hydrolase [Methanomicrobium antiquum]WFN37350.1 metal-dependent hydrolase [Methanomicrobium antiquum]
MLFFCHLLSGFVAGFILFLIFKDRRVILITAFGSIIPDLIDKPLGHIVFSETIGSGRIFFHGFWIMIILLICGTVIYLKFKNPTLFSFASGILVHQAGDNMWSNPQNWFWPLLGPYVTKNRYDDYFFSMILAEISSVEEIFCLILIIIGICVYFAIESR